MRSTRKKRPYAFGRRLDPNSTKVVLVACRRGHRSAPAEKEPSCRRCIPFPNDFAAHARIRKADYESMYAESVKDPEGFWSRIGKRLDWTKPYTKIKDVSYDAKNLHIRWYHDGELNLSANCLDRHLANARRQDRDPLGRRRSERIESDQLSRAARAGVQSREHAEESRRGERRSRHDLYADDSGSGGRDARLRAHRRGAHGRVRRLFAGFAGRTHFRFDIESSSSPPTKVCAAARKCR